MLFDGMRAAIDGARTLAQLDELSRRVWQACAAEAVDAAGAQALAELVEARRQDVRGTIKPVGIPTGRLSLFPPRRACTSPDRLASRDRRRLLASSGPMPPALAARFTVGQLAVLKIVGEEFARAGVCGLCVDAIAARAGVCRRLAQGAIRLAAGDGLLVVQERRREGRKNETNLIRIVGREWLAWIKRGRRAAPTASISSTSIAGPGGIGCKTLHPTDSRALQGNVEAQNRGKRSAEGQGPGRGSEGLRFGRG